MAGKRRSTPSDAIICALQKEWDEVVCPICMDHPHNAVLLLCSSHGKGCRPYMCDTSYRHSNCLDRFKQLELGSTNSTSPSRSVHTSQVNSGSGVSFNNELVGVDYSGGNTEDRGVIRERINGGVDAETVSASNMSLRCPLCKGSVLGWKVMEEARSYLNLKLRSCSRESCSFSGNYLELRRHARRVHPSARPGRVDPSRERAWRRLESQTERDDIFSALQSAMPGAVVLGDYVIEDSEILGSEREDDIESVFFYVDESIVSRILDDSPVPRRRRRLSRSRAHHRY